MSVERPPSPRRGKRAKGAGRKAELTAREDEKDARIRQLEARIAELESSGKDGRAEAGAVITEPKQDEETLRHSEQRLGRSFDVSERPPAEVDAIIEVPQQERHDAEHRLESLLANSPLAVIEWSSDDTRIVRWSDEATRVFGWTAEESIGQRISESNWIDPEDRPLVEAVIADMLSGKRPRSVNKHRNVRKDGSVIHCEWFNSTLHDPSGRFSVLSFVLDLTEREQVEAALRAANLQLAEADQRKNEFLAVLSHKLRNRLAPIKSSLWVLVRATAGGDQVRRAQAVIERQVDQLARLVDDLLDVTRITRNEIKLQRQRLELSALVRQTIEDQRPLFDKAEVHLEFHPAPRPVFVNADGNRLAQVIGNLLQNAAKFTGPGGATLVTVHAERAEKRAAIQVVDTGVGMAPEMVSRLFQPFSQVDSSSDRSKGGLGLGLALVKGLVELHGGDVTAQSAGLGQGAEFTVHLPLAMEEATASQTGSENAAKSRRRVLVIEDNIDAADSLREVLASGEHEVEVAYSGPEGIAKAREFRPEAVLCDIGPPGMDGLEVARAFKADESLKDVFLVALSGYTLPEDLQRASEAGFERHLPKPASLEEVEALLAALPAPGPHGKAQGGPAE